MDKPKAIEVLKNLMAWDVNAGDLMENHAVTVQDALRYAVDYMEGKITDESFQHKYPEWYLPKLVCANVICKFNSFRNTCACPQVRLSYRHLHTTNEGFVDVYECKSFEEQMKSEEITRLEELMEFINKHSVYGFTCKEKDDADNND